MVLVGSGILTLQPCSRCLLFYALDFKLRGVYTHTTPVDAYRGAGRPEAAFLIERLIDAAAREIDMPVAELRRRNFIRPDQFPYHTPGGRMYDVGEFDGHMTRALEKANVAGFSERAREAESRGKLRGLGTAVYIEACAFAGSEEKTSLSPWPLESNVPLPSEPKRQGEAHLY